MKNTCILITSLLLLTSNSFASNRYWVGGAGIWDNSSTTHWATSSGGVSGASVPDSTDDVFFDANSGASTVIQSANTYAKNFNGLGFTGTISNSIYSFFVYGDITLGAGMTITSNNDSYWVCAGNGTTHNLIQNGASFNSNLIMNAVGGTLVFQSDLVLSGGTYGGNLFCQNGTINANNQNVTIKYLATNNSYAGIRNITMGSGIWTITGFSWDVGTAPGLTLNANTSTIKFIDSTNTAKTFNGGGLAYYNFWCTNGSGGPFDVVYIKNSNTFNDFKINAGGNVTFQSGTTSAFTSFTAIGTPARHIEIATDLATYTFSKLGGGIVCCDYLDISFCQAIQSNTWYAGTHSMDNGGNTDWIFSALITLNINSQTNVTCNGDNNGSATINANGGVSPLYYSWLPIGGSAATANGLSADTYTCTVTDFCGLATDTVSVIITEPNTITGSLTLNVCSGDSVTVGSSTYTVSGIYTDTITATNGCDSAVTTNLTVNPLPTVSLSSLGTVCINWNTFILTGGIPVGGTYSGVGVSSNMFNPSIAGAGTHTITYTYTDSNGCSNSTIENITVDLCTGINELTADNLFSIYPNPTNGQFVILISADDATITVTNILGQQLIKMQATQKTSKLQLENNGVYIVYVTTKQGTTTKKITVNH